MLGLLCVAAAVIVVYKAAEMGNRQGWFWAMMAVGLGIINSMLVGTLLAGIITLVVMMLLMFIANIIHDPTKA